MKKIKDFLLLNNIHRTIDADDVVERQRFILFRLFSLLAFWTCAGMFTEIYATIPMPLMQSVPLLAVFFMLNYFLLNKHRNRRAAYFILVSLIFCEIHITSYFIGGLQNNGWFFSASTLLAAFMLLGTRAGFYYSAFVILNQFYFYYISENTTWVSNMLENASSSVINLDYFITGSLSLLVIAVQLISLEGSKNSVLKTLNHSRKELRNKNAELHFMISEKRKAEEQLAEYVRTLEASYLELEQKNKDLDRFAYIVSHDLKAPLRAIGAMTKFIEEDANEKLPQETHQHLDIIRSRIKRMEKLITDILNYSQSTRSKKTISEFRLKEIVHDTIDLIMLPPQCKIEIQGGETLLTSDATRLKQVILNLMVNAIKHHHNKTNIEIKISVTDEISQWHFCIADNGPGIAPQFHERIFEIFQRLTSKEDAESSGIGLAIVKKIVEDVNGKIWIESEHDRGAAFHFTFAKEKIKQPEAKAELAGH